METQLQIKSVGRMWWVYCGKIVLSFASTYPFATARAEDLITTGVVERVIQKRNAR